VGPEKAARTSEIIRKIGYRELMRFKVGLDGLAFRPVGQGDSTVGIVSERELASLASPEGFHRVQLESARQAGAATGLLFFGSSESVEQARKFVQAWDPRCTAAFVTVPKTEFLLDGVTRVGVKMALNSLSTCTMVRLGRVMGNFMIWVVASNLKLIDRATRYIQKLTGLGYEPANQLLFEVIEYVEPRMKADQAYPPVVGVAVLRARHGLTNEEAERRLAGALGAMASLG
jgi:N-acetylmuramic acid 6-phosphate (MurNAc-6-P) etherase